MINKIINNIEQQMTCDDAIESLVNVYGSKNLLVNTATSHMDYNCAITVNKNGMINLTTNGANYTGTQAFVLLGSFTVPETRDYIINGFSDSDQNCFMILYDETIQGYVWRQVQSPSTISLDSTHVYNMEIASEYEDTSPINGTFYPMLRDARIEDDTYVPYAPTNRQLATVQPEINCINSVLGSKNVLKVTASSKTDENRTIIVNSNGSVTISGSSSSADWFPLEEAKYTAGYQTLRAGYRLVCETSQGAYAYIVGADDAQGTNAANYTAQDGSIIIPDRNYYSSIYIFIPATSNFTTAFTFRPRIIPAAITDTSFTKYSMTNKQLTDTIDTMQGRSNDQFLVLTAISIAPNTARWLYGITGLFKDYDIISVVHLPDLIDETSIFTVSRKDNYFALYTWTAKNAGELYYVTIKVK